MNGLMPSGRGRGNRATFGSVESHPLYASGTYCATAGDGLIGAAACGRGRGGAGACGYIVLLLGVGNLPQPPVEGTGSCAPPVGKSASN